MSTTLTSLSNGIFGLTEHELNSININNVRTIVLTVMPHPIQLFFGKHEHYDNDLFSYRKLLIDLTEPCISILPSYIKCECDCCPKSK